MKRFCFMKFLTAVVIACLLLTTASVASAHSGRTDANGGHNCSEKSKAKGLCTGYHYHNGGSSSSSTSSNTKNSTSSKNSSSKNSSSKNNSSSNKNSSSSKQAKDELKTSDISLYINGEKIKLTNKPLVKNNSTYFPIREIAEAIDASISFSDDKTELILNRNNKTVTFKLSSKEIISKNNTTYAPIRGIVEKLGGKVTFDAKNNAIKVEIK